MKVGLIISGIVLISFILIGLMAFIATSHIPTMQDIRSVLSIMVGGFLIGVVASVAKRIIESREIKCVK